MHSRSSAQSTSQGMPAVGRDWHVPSNDPELTSASHAWSEGQGSGTPKLQAPPEPLEPTHSHVTVSLAGSNPVMTQLRPARHSIPPSGSHASPIPAVARSGSDVHRLLKQLRKPAHSSSSAHDAPSPAGEPHMPPIHANPTEHSSSSAQAPPEGVDAVHVPGHAASTRQYASPAHSSVVEQLLPAATVPTNTSVHAAGSTVTSAHDAPRTASRQRLAADPSYSNVPAAMADSHKGSD